MFWYNLVCHLNQSTSSCDSLSAEFKALPKHSAASFEYQLRDKKEKRRIRTSIEHPASARKSRSAAPESSCPPTFAIAPGAPVGLISWVSSQSYPEKCFYLEQCFYPEQCFYAKPPELLRPVDCGRIYSLFR
jgi:hypothetical protein